MGQKHELPNCLTPDVQQGQLISTALGAIWTFIMQPVGLIEEEAFEPVGGKPRLQHSRGRDRQ